VNLRVTREESLRLISVHAHPDDESSKGAATLAKYAAEGVDVLVVTCTGGERGTVLNPAMDRPRSARRPRQDPPRGDDGRLRHPRRPPAVPFVAFRGNETYTHGRDSDDRAQAHPHHDRRGGCRGCARPARRFCTDRRSGGGAAGRWLPATGGRA